MHEAEYVNKGNRMLRAVATPRVRQREGHFGARAEPPGTDAPKINTDQGWLLKALLDGQRVVIAVGGELIALRVERTHADYVKLAIDIPRAAVVAFEGDKIARLMEEREWRMTESRPAPAPSAVGPDDTGLAGT